MSDREAVTPSDSRPSPSPPLGTGEERGSSSIHQQQADYKLVWVEKDPNNSVESKDKTVAALSSPLISADKPSETTPTLRISPGPAPSPTGSLTSPLSPVPPPSVPCILFEAVHYLGSSTVDAPVSENEANRKMTILKEQAAQSIPVTLSIPDNKTGISHTFCTCTYMTICERGSFKNTRTQTIFFSFCIAFSCIRQDM